MLLLGTTMFGANYTADSTPTSITSLKSIKIQNGIYDELLITKNIEYTYAKIIPSEWDFDTMLHALFNGNLKAGNVDFSLSQASHVKIKVREKGSFEWLTIYEIPIQTIEDFNIERFYNYCRGYKTEYEVALVSVTDNVEGNLNINSIVSDFDGVAIFEKDKAFIAELDPKTGNAQKNRPSALINTFDRKYPYFITNGNNNYYNGSTTATFIPFNSLDNQYDIKNGFKYRKDLLDFLCDGKPKVLKYPDGRIWLVCIHGSPSENENGYYENIATSFEWSEIGDINSQSDLYDNNLIDVAPI